MKTPSFIFAADTHLDPLIWSTIPAIAGDAYDSFRQVVDYALQYRVPLILGGDVFDKRRPHSASVQFAASQLDRLQAAGVACYYIQGQHCLAEPPWLSVHSWPQHLHKCSVALPGFPVVYGLDWCPAGTLQAELAAMPHNTNVLIAHQVWQDFMGTHCQTEGKLGEVPFAQHVFTGDFHETTTKTLLGATGQNLQVYSPGATHMRAIDQAGDKSCFLVSTEDGRAVVELLKLDTRPVFKLEIPNDATTAERFSEVCRRLESGFAEQQQLRPSRFDRPILLVVYPEGIPEASERLKAAVKESAYLFEDIQSEARSFLSERTNTERTTVFSIPEAVVTLNLPEATAHRVRRLWDTADVAKELEAMQSEFV